MAAIDVLKGLFERDLKHAAWGRDVKVDDSDPKRIDVRFYTETNEYSLVLVPETEDRILIEATVRSRKARAGEATQKSRRLLRGNSIRLSDRVWRRFLGGIVGLELVRVHRRGKAEETDEPDERMTELEFDEAEDR